jgi:Fe-S oxidoreductase
MSLLRAVDKGQIALDEEVGEVFFHCTGCLRCQTWCMHDNDLPTAMRAARALVVDSGVQVPVAIRNIVDSLHEHGAPGGAPPALPEKASAVFDEAAEIAYFPGCKRRELDPEGVVIVGRLLAEVLGARVSLFQGDPDSPVSCCGAGLVQAGFPDDGHRWRQRWGRSLDSFDLVVTECGDLADTRDPKIVHLVDLLYERITDWMPRTESHSDDVRVVLHDSCRPGRRLGLHDATRGVLTAAMGRAPDEMWLCRDEALCCGAGDHYPAVNPAGAGAAANLVTTAARDQGCDLLVSASPMCVAHMRSAGGDDSLEVLDLARVVARALGVDP